MKKKIESRRRQLRRRRAKTCSSGVARGVPFTSTWTTLTSSCDRLTKKTAYIQACMECRTYFLFHTDSNNIRGNVFFRIQVYPVVEYVCYAFNVYFCKINYFDAKLGFKYFVPRSSYFSHYIKNLNANLCTTKIHSQVFVLILINTEWTKFCFEIIKFHNNTSDKIIFLV